MQFPKLRMGGFSLVELILALAIASLLASVVGSFALAWQARTYASYSEAQLQNDFRFALNVIAYHLRKAKTIAKGYSSSSYVLLTPDGASMTFGHHSVLQTLWVKDSSIPICSYVAKFEVDMSRLPLVTLKLTSVDKLPGIERGLPVTISRQIRMRNYGK